jgi:hypothetical protein
MKKPDICELCGNKRGNGKKFCKACSAKRDYYRTTISNKKRNKEHWEKSTFLESRKINAFCKSCEHMGRNPHHKVTVKVQHHVVIKQPYYKFCKLCTVLAERDYTETYSLSGLGRERD